MDFAINVHIDSDENEDAIRDALATLVESALALLPHTSAVGTMRR